MDSAVVFHMPTCASPVHADQCYQAPSAQPLAAKRAAVPGVNVDAYMVGV